VDAGAAAPITKPFTAPALLPLTATTGDIGAPANDLDVSAGALFLSAAGNIYLEDTSGTLNLYNTTSAGDLSFTANAINVIAANTVTSTAGNISLTTNALDVAGNLNAANNINIAPRTATTTIGLGGGAGALNLTDAEFSNMAAGNTINIGSNAASGAIEIGSVDLSAEATHLNLNTSGAITDAKGDRSLRPNRQPNPDSYLRIVERNARGIVISGVKAIVTGAPYMHELLIMPCRTYTAEDADFAVCCAVPVDADGVTIVARPAGRPGEPAATFTGRYGQSTGVVILDDVFVPHDRVFLAGETVEGGFLTTAYATHHRHSCIGARAGFGDLLIGAGALMIEANGLDPNRLGQRKSRGRAFPGLHRAADGQIRRIRADCRLVH